MRNPSAEPALGKWIALSCVTAVVLATMAELWTYVANVMDLDEVTRETWKHSLFVSAILLVVVVNVIVALSSGSGWWRRVSWVMGVVFLGTFSMKVMFDLITGRHFPRTQAPVVLQVLEGVFFLLLWVVIGVIISLAVAAVTRLLAYPWIRSR